MSTSAPNHQHLPEIPGVEYLQAREPKSRRIFGPFFSDEVDNIVRSAQTIRTRHKLGTLFIAPDGIGGALSIYKRRAA
ncbi:MAG TPA: hypothetical protein VGM54_02145 [Chthoniobacter sp.]|jgi:hypothetical protein